MRTELDAHLSRAAVGLAEPDVFTEFSVLASGVEPRWRHVPVGPSRRSCREPGVSPRVRQNAELPGNARLGGSRERSMHPHRVGIAPVGSGRWIAVA